MRKDNNMNRKYVIMCVVGLAMSLNGLAQRISFDKTVENAGSTIWKKPVTAVFKFTNRDKTPLLIRDVDAGCGCLTPKWTRDPLLKGDDGEMVKIYLSKKGEQSTNVVLAVEEEEATLVVISGTFDFAKMLQQGMKMSVGVNN